MIPIFDFLAIFPGKNYYGSLTPIDAVLAMCEIKVPGHFPYELLAC